MVSIINVDVIRNVRDPEKPYTIEELGIVDEDCVSISKSRLY